MITDGASTNAKFISIGENTVARRSAAGFWIHDLTIQVHRFTTHSVYAKILRVRESRIFRRVAGYRIIIVARLSLSHLID